ncbi:Cytochrome c-type bioproteinsis protein Ccs1/ResB [Prochlorococcus sp. MIT 0602]|nr:Cytochrome c-type bioproteinsis protein Ccs1/ResB [Prochlorococcus sp. MIT 0602]
MRRVINWLASLKVAIVLLLLIAISSSIGTAVPQGQPAEIYLSTYSTNKFLGWINGELLLQMQLDHVYSSLWFIILLAWLSLSLIICSWKRQFPTLQKSMAWIDYKDPKQIQKLAISKTFKVNQSDKGIGNLEDYLIHQGWNVQKKSYRLAARKGLIGRVGPPLVHFGMIVLMFGATLGVLQGDRLEKFLAPERSLDLLSPNGINKVNLKLTDFQIERGPNGEPEQFRSKLELTDKKLKKEFTKEISVNHPLRFNGITIYQADWSLASITIQIDGSPKLQFPLNKIDELGEQVWGVVIPSMNTPNDQVLLTVSSEEGPVRAFNIKGNSIGLARPDGGIIETANSKIKVFNILPSSGILLKYDPGVPIVYIGFSIFLIGSILSIISTKQIWIISEKENSLLYIGGLSNRNTIGFANQFPLIVKAAYKN